LASSGAVTIAHHYRPVWCVIDAGNMAQFPVLPGIQCLVIGADNDPAGSNAANECADRWAAAGVDVRVIVPDMAGADWNDAGRPA
jgi:putative DNA primase/helicase